MPEIINAGKLPMDPRVVRAIQGSSTMRAEQGEDWLAGWGGPSAYCSLASLPLDERVAYVAVLNGAKGAEDINVMTEGTGVEMSLDQAQGALDKLTAKGLM